MDGQQPDEDSRVTPATISRLEARRLANPSHPRIEDLHEFGRRRLGQMAWLDLKQVPKTTVPHASSLFVSVA
jgi:hypothetical protein